jgi:hypothetical protein
VSATTDGEGRARASLPIPTPAGDKPLSVSFAGDERYAAESAEATFQATREDSSVLLNVSRLQSNARLVAFLTETDNRAPLGGRIVQFSVNGESLGSALTDADGRAAKDVPIKRIKKGDRVRATFAGDETYLGSSASVLAGARGEKVTSK